MHEPQIHPKFSSFTGHLNSQPPRVITLVTFHHFISTHALPLWSQLHFTLSDKNINQKMAKTTPDADHTAATTKVAEDVESGNVVVSRTERKLPRKYDAMHLALRLICFLASLVSLVVMTSAKEKSTMSLYGLDLPIYSKWSFSQSFE